MIFVDSNIPMYLVGGEHPHKADTRAALERLVTARERLVTDAEVLQEILHRYAAIRRLDMIQPAFDALLGVVDEVFELRRRDAEAAKDVLLGAAELSARDAIHVAVMRSHGVEAILSFDRGFDTVPGLRRIS